MHKLFVYGSLKKGFHNHERCRLDEARFISPAITQQSFTMVSLGGYPAIHLAQEDKPSCQIHGELYDVPEEIYAPIYRMEVGAGYSIMEITVFDPGLHEEGGSKAEIFYHKKPIRIGAIIVPDGIWKNPYARNETQAANSR